MIGLLGTFSTVAIGYYMVYRKDEPFGLCFSPEYPGIRRACVLDLTGGVMSILISVLFIMIECVSAYLNKPDVSCAVASYILTLTMKATCVVSIAIHVPDGMVWYVSLTYLHAISIHVISL